MRFGLTAIAVFLAASMCHAKPAHLKALADTIGPGFAKAVNDCRTCHLPEGKDEDRPHNPFGKRIAEWRKDRRKAGLSNDIADAIDALADEDVDKDGTPNLIELLAGRFPGELNDVPTLAEHAEAKKKLTEWRAARSDYAWKPFQPVVRPAVPKVKNAEWVRNPIDAFVAEQQEKRGLTPNRPANKAALLRRVYLDLIGLPPTREQFHAFLNDNSERAYEKVVDELLRSPLYGEAQARNWMDVWRYSDWAGFGNEIRESQPHIWRWRDWIVESMNANKPYSRMIQEMLAADELTPDDENSLRATGFVVRNWYKFSRDIVLDRTVEHTGKAFLGVTINCAKCHDHMYDPISQVEFFAFRAIFEPNDFRIDRVPGQPEISKDGLVRVYDANAATPTYLYVRGNEKEPDKSKPIFPAVPASLGGKFQLQPVKLPSLAVSPDNRAFVLEETRIANDKAAAAAVAPRETMSAKLGVHLIGTNSWSLLARAWTLPLRADQQGVAAQDAEIARLKRDVFKALLAVEVIDKKTIPEEWRISATKAGQHQRELAVAEAKKALHLANISRWQPTAKGQPEPAKKIAEAQTILTNVDAAFKAPPTPTFTPRAVKAFPAESTGRRLALANWIVDVKNPLTARVAMNHLWLRRFGVGIVPTVFDFGKNGQPPSHPKLLDWLAAEFVERGWSLRDMHRLIVLSNTYRQASETKADESAKNRQIDADNKFLWKMPARRMTAETVRDSVLAVAGELDLKQGGPEIDQNAGMTSKRRSLYFRHAPEKQMVFLELFDGASPTECYKRSESIAPQQALALANSPLTQAESKVVAVKLSKGHADDSAFITAAFETVLSRSATNAERETCREFLIERTATSKLSAEQSKERARASLILVLMNHNDFVSVR